MICAASRYLIVAWVVGVVAASVTGNEMLAWAAAATAVLLTYGLSRWGPQRLRVTTCAVPVNDGTLDSSVRSGR